MSTQIEREFTFQAGVYFENKFMMNVYDISLSMFVETDSIREQNIAMDRIKYFLSECLESSVFVQDAEKKAIEKFQAAGIKVCVLPEEPYDQIVAMVVLQKLNAIMEGRIRVTDIDFGSAITSGVRFQLVSEMAEAMVSVKGWWTKTDMSIMDVIKTKDNIVKLCDPKAWDNIGLSWKEKVDA